MIILAESHIREDLFPFTYTRHTADIRIGILTIRKKWELLTGEKVSTDETSEGVHIPANIIPTKDNFEAIIKAAEKNETIEETETVKIIRYPFHIFHWNDHALRKDFALISAGRTSQPLSSSNRYSNPENIFIEEGASVEHSIINASEGPVYIGKNAEIMEGNLIRGPFSIGENSKLKMGSRIYGATTIGPNCIAGGEIRSAVFFANSNKAHEGYLGHSVIGEWCNLGAGTTNSNLKNSAGEVSYLSAKAGKTISAGTKAGLLMGDYSRSSINTSFNTGSTVGVCCNIFGEKMPPKFTQNFTWGTERYIFEKAIRDIDNWKKLKGQSVTAEEAAMLRTVYELGQ